MKDITTPITTLYSWAIRWNQNPGLFGKQMVFPVLMWNDTYDLADMHNNLQSCLNVSSGTPLEKFAVGNYVAAFTMKNMSNMDLFYDIYTIMAREDMDSNLAPARYWQPNAGGPQYADCLSLFTRGINEMDSSNPDQYNIPPGMTPYDISLFCSYYKIIKKRVNQRLIGGGDKRYAVNDRKWRLWDGSKLVGANGNTTAVNRCFGRRTKMVFILMRGQPIGDFSNGANASIAPCNVIISGEERYMFTGTANTQKRLYRQTGYTGISNPSTMLLQTEVSAPYVIT